MNKNNKKKVIKNNDKQICKTDRGSRECTGRQ